MTQEGRSHTWSVIARTRLDAYPLCRCSFSVKSASTVVISWTLSPKDSPTQSLTFSPNSLTRFGIAMRVGSLLKVTIGAPSSAPEYRASHSASKGVTGSHQVSG